MGRQRTSRAAAGGSVRSAWRDRHGRGLRSAVTGPHLPLLHTRADVFDLTVASTAEYLKDMWPHELQGVSFEVAGLPKTTGEAARIERWRVIPDEKRVIMYRLAIERLAKVHHNDELHRRMLVESCVFRAVAELLGKDPWDLAPERFRHL